MKRLITGLLSFVMLLGCSACFNQAGQSPSTGLDSSLAALKSGFSCFDEIRFFEYGNFYKASINTDKQYVTEGDTSGKFSFRGGVPSTFSTYNVWSNTNYFGDADFTRAQAITVEVFNPSETSHRMWLSFSTSKDGAMTTFQKYPETEYELTSGYNLISLVIDRASASFLCDMKYVSYISFRFENEQNPYELYMDNLRVHYTDEQIEKMEKTYKEDELLFFDDPADLFFMTTPLLYSPTLSICRDPKYISSGSGSLMMEFSEESIGSGIEYWTAARLSGEPIERVDFSNYSQIKYTLMSTCGNMLAVRFTDASGTRYTMTWPYEVLQDGVRYERFADLSVVEEAGLNMKEIEAIEFLYMHVQNDGTKAMFIDDITLIK